MRTNMYVHPCTGDPRQELDRSIVDLNDVISEVPTNAQTTPLIEDAEKVREEANKVMKVSSERRLIRSKSIPLRLVNSAVLPRKTCMTLTLPIT